MYRCVYAYVNAYTGEYFCSVCVCASWKYNFNLAAGDMDQAVWIRRHGAGAALPLSGCQIQLGLFSCNIWHRQQEAAGL